MTDPGTLYLCATPIGNLEDITLRVLHTLEQVDLIACEDTRKTLHLLNHFGIAKPVTSYYEHNKSYKGDQIIRALLDGQNVALVSDAGMPGISDPGFDLAQQCLAHGISYTVLPGACAAVTGLVLSGLATDRFAFEGFLSRQKNERLNRLQQLLTEERTLIFYEAPHRLLSTLEAMQEVFGPRQMAAARELTKKFEEVCRGTIAEVMAHFQAQGIKGEFVLIVQGAEPLPPETHDLDWAAARTRALEEDGLTAKDAIKQAAVEAGLSKRAVYNYMMAAKRSQKGEALHD